MAFVVENNSSNWQLFMSNFFCGNTFIVGLTIRYSTIILDNFNQIQVFIFNSLINIPSGENSNLEYLP
jgi:hypothetical protein